eukprot:TRINITY_DN8680_c0_g1_i10.p1 TRINITY_DN8680_c0_g1~~TRINITY_DN8680_c0_g1_i10.p1  ORF type:complete len:102 (-),score=13.38 TRINITY_DN8680_c0_g1_i10:126-431(-)
MVGVIFLRNAFFLLQQVLSLQQSLLSQLGRQQSTQEQGQTGGGTGAPNNMGLELLMNMFGGLGADGLSVPNRSDGNDLVFCYKWMRYFSTTVYHLQFCTII